MGVDPPRFVPEQPACPQRSGIISRIVGGVASSNFCALADRRECPSVFPEIQVQGSLAQLPLLRDSFEKKPRTILEDFLETGEPDIRKTGNLAYGVLAAYMVLCRHHSRTSAADVRLSWQRRRVQRRTIKLAAESSYSELAIK